MGDSDVVDPIEIDVDQDFSQGRNIMLYVAGVNVAADKLLASAIEEAVANTIAFNKGFVKLVGWDRNGHREWEQTARGRKHASTW